MSADLAPDGSPVAFYRRLPAMGEPELIHATIPGGASILDLGCGPGRLAGPLAALGHPVTGVDNGAGMIAALPDGVEGIVADAARLRLGRRFGCVLLASHLVTDPVAGPAFAATAAAHLAVGGTVVGQTYPPGWDAAAALGTRTRLGEADVELAEATVVDGVLHAVVRYGVGGTTWEQSFDAVVLDETGLATMLDRAGLRFDAWLPMPGWFRASGRPGA